MAQFDIFRNTSKTTVKHFPYLLEVQSDLFSDATRAVVIPLVDIKTLRKPDKVLNVKLIVPGGTVRLFPLDIASAPRSALGAKVCTVSNKGDSIVAALELLFARF